MLLKSKISVEERLSALFDAVSKDRATEQDTLKELRDLKFGLRDSYRKEKLGAAITWAEIYFSPRKLQKWGDSRERVRDFLLDELYKTRMATLSEQDRH